MPILFRVKPRHGYFVTIYRGHIPDEEHLLAFEHFFTGKEWDPSMNELAIASEARSSSISYDSLRSLLALKNRYYRENNVTHVKIAIYAPDDLAFGIARMYDVITDESPEEVRPFRDVREAMRWLKK